MVSSLLQNILGKRALNVKLNEVFSTIIPQIQMKLSGHASNHFLWHGREKGKSNGKN